MLHTRDGLHLNTEHQKRRHASIVMFLSLLLHIILVCIFSSCFLYLDEEKTTTKATNVNLFILVKKYDLMLIRMSITNQHICPLDIEKKKQNLIAVKDILNRLTFHLQIDLKLIGYWTWKIVMLCQSYFPFPPRIKRYRSVTCGLKLDSRFRLSESRL